MIENEPSTEAYVSEVDPGPTDPGPDYNSEPETNSRENNSLENPAYADSLDSVSGHDIADVEESVVKYDHLEKHDLTYEDSEMNEGANTALITYQNEQHTTDTFSDNNRDSFSDSSYVDTLTSNDSRTALLSDKKNFSVPPVFSSQTIITLPKTVKEFDVHTRSVSSRDLSNTKMGLFESSAYIDHLSFLSPSQRQLESACRNAVLTLSQDIIPQKFQSVPSKLAVNNEGPDEQAEVMEDDDEDGDFNSISRHMKNLIFLGISISLMNTAIGSLRNLQSSLNHDNGVGLYSLAAGMTGFMIFSLFTPFIVQRFRPKKCVVLSLIPQLLYVFSNIYPSFHVFIPAAFLQGVSNAVLWNAISTYITYLARSYALQNDVRTVPIASKYFGIFFFFYQFSIVAGNLISSLVLMNGKTGNDHTNDPSVLTNVSSKVIYLMPNATTRLTNTVASKDGHLQFCGANYCHTNNITMPGLYVDDETKYVLLGIYGLCVAFSIVIALYLLDMLKPYRTAYASCSVVCKQLVSVLKCAVDPRFLRLFPLFAYTTMQLSFVAGDVTKAFVTCTVGIHMVGYTMVCYGICGGIASYISGCLNKHLGHLVLITSAAVSNLILILVMYMWQPSPGQLVLYIVLVGCWGLTDGIWLSQASSLIGQIFPDKLEEAFAAQRFVQGLGGAVTYCYASSLCTTVKMMILAAACLLGLICYILQEIISRRKPLDVEDMDTKSEPKSV